jgi:hypothetical protein
MTPSASPSIRPHSSPPSDRCAQASSANATSRSCLETRLPTSRCMRTTLGRRTPFQDDDLDSFPLRTSVTVPGIARSCSSFSTFPFLLTLDLPLSIPLFPLLPWTFPLDRFHLPLTLVVSHSLFAVKIPFYLGSLSFGRRRSCVLCRGS